MRPLRRLGIGRITAHRPVPWLRRLLSISAIVRWVGLGVAGTVGVVAPPRASALLVVLILLVAGYNAWSMLAARRARDESILRIARSVTVLDEIACFVFIAIFTELPGGPQSAFYVPMVIEAVGYDGVFGAVQSVAVFVVGIIALEVAGTAFFHLPLSWPVVLVWSLIMAVVGTSAAALERSMLAVTPVAGGDGGLAALGGVAQAAEAPRLSPREKEVLNLIAAGYSNAMIAATLHLSETTVKTYVQSLLTRLNARNRAEAVAAGSRLHLL